MEGWSVLQRASEMAARGEAFALATVVWRQGPSSGQLGSRAIITADGELDGWIGGACAEPVVLRAARQAIEEGTSKLLLLGTPGQFGDSVPEGMTVVPIACQSEGALEIFIEPVLPVPHLIVYGTSPMAQTLAGLAGQLGWRADLVGSEEQFAAADPRPSTMVVVATQGHGDEEAVERAIAARPAYLGLVGSAKRGATVLGYLADRGLPASQLDRVQVPAGLDLGHTTHAEIAVAILAELVQRRAAAVAYGHADQPSATRGGAAVAVDPVCGMVVTAGPAGRPVEHEGVTFYFCSAGCRGRFGKDPAEYAGKES
jgi:xanthine dehydrogenase accessory factor